MRQNAPVIIELHAKEVFTLQDKKIKFYDSQVLCCLRWIYMTHKAICVKMKGEPYSDHASSLEMGVTGLDLGYEIIDDLPSY